MISDSLPHLLVIPSREDENLIRTTIPMERSLRNIREILQSLPPMARIEVALTDVELMLLAINRR